MQGFAAPALKKVRVGCIGLGMRGPGAVHRLANIPGVEVVALCDIYKERVDAQQAWLKKNGKPPAREYINLHSSLFFHTFVHLKRDYNFFITNK